MTVTEIKQLIDNSPPHCVSGFHLQKSELPEFFDNNFKSVYMLSCLCGNQSGEILGYYLRDYNKEVSKKDNSMITPLGFKCTKCNTITEVLDSDFHGYHAEYGILEGYRGSVKYRGEGPRKSHKCPKCSQKKFEKIIAGFVYWNLDEWVNEPPLPWQNFFNVFLFHTSCANCNHISEPISLGKL